MTDRSRTTEKQCITCANDRTKRHFTCDGCRQTFCSAHVTEHREELNGKLTKLIEEYQLLEKNSEKSLIDHQNFLKRIDEWENQSIRTIQSAADRARRTLDEFTSTNRQRLKQSADDLATNLHQAQRSTSFTEENLKEWKINLKRLERQLNQRSTIKLVDSEETSIPLIEMKIPEIIMNVSHYLINKDERFLDVLGPVDIERKGFVVTHNSETEQYGYVKGKMSYGLGRSAVRFRIEKFQKPYALFFGCIASKVKLCEGIFKSDQSVGWFSCTEAYRHGYCDHNYRIHNYNGDRIERGDILTLVFDRELNEIQLINKRINMISSLKVGEQLKYDEWQLLIVLTYPGDSVRLLSN